MKWGRRKPPSPSLSRSSSVSSIFPLSWISKFKQISGISECKPTKAKSGMGCRSVPTPTSWKDGRFYAGDEDSYWRLSFGDENFERQKSRGGLQSVRYVSDDELEEFTFPSCQNCQRDADDVTERQEAWKFNQTVSNIRKLRELPCSEDSRNGENIDFKVPRGKSQKDRKWRKRNGGNMEETMSEFERQSDRAEDIQTIPEEKDIYELLLVKITDETQRDCQKRAYSSSKKHGYNSYANSSNLNLRTGGEDSMPEALNLEGDGLSEGRLNSEWKKLEGMKIKDLMAKSETQRKSIYISRELQRRTKQSSKVKAYSPRTAYRIECKIKAIEDMKKSKKKMDKKMKEKPVRERTAFDRFAFVKSSFDPHGDFRNSMIEMITTKGIRKAEELEELLACYLTLNVDEYHDIIIKVFRQVWFELKQDYLAPEFQS